MSAPTIQRARGVQYKTIDGIQEVTGRHIEFIASQEIQDRDGDIVRIGGIDTHDFMQNSVLLADHDPTFILGTITKLWKERLPDGWALLAKAEILPAGTSGRIDERYAAIKQGAAKGVSIGFIGREREPIATGWFYKYISLMEVSSVAIPSCPTCLITSKSTARHSQKEDRMYCTHTTLEDRTARQLAELLAGQGIEIHGKEVTTEDAFDDMLAAMRTHYEADHEYRAMMDAQMSLLGPHATIAELCRAMMAQGVVAARSWTPETYDVDDAMLARCIGRVVADEVGRQTRDAFNTALGRLD